MGKPQKRFLYHKELERHFRFLVPQQSRVLEIGCAEGRLLASVDPKAGHGIDISEERIARAREIHENQSNLSFVCANAESVDWQDQGPFDYILLSDVVPLLHDIQQTLTNLRSVCLPSTRVVLSYHNNLWRPFLTFGTWIGMREKVPYRNWLSSHDVMNLLHLAGFECVSNEGRILSPLWFPLLSWVLNRFLAKLPGFRRMCLAWFVVARPKMRRRLPEDEPTVSVLIPTRNEKGNIEAAFRRTPLMGKWTELVFVDGNSDDGTVEEIQRCIQKYQEQWPRTKLVAQTGRGKGQAVRQGFDECSGDLLMILDSDLTMPPEQLTKYYDAAIQGRGEFINGCRLVYPQEDKAMRLLNMIMNHFFAHLFSYLLGQRIKDTLCGTKVLWKLDYHKIAANREFFGDFDPFGDFDLLFGAAKLNLKIVDLPVRYDARTYGEIKIRRFHDGFLLIGMSWIAFKRFKLH